MHTYRIFPVSLEAGDGYGYEVAAPGGVVCARQEHRPRVQGLVPMTEAEADALGAAEAALRTNPPPPVPDTEPEWVPPTEG